MKIFWLNCAHDFSIVLVWLVLKRIKCFPIYLGNVIFNRVLIVKFSGYVLVVVVSVGSPAMLVVVCGCPTASFLELPWIQRNQYLSIRFRFVHISLYLLVLILTRISQHTSGGRSLKVLYFWSKYSFTFFYIIAWFNLAKICEV